MPGQDLFEGFSWHSSMGMDCALDGSRRFVTRLPNTHVARAMFIMAGDSFLVHKTTRCLWKLSDDKKSIEPVFSSDVLTEEELKAAMEDEK